MTKGLSPLIASVLLIGIAFSVAAILGPWAFGLVRSDTDTLSNNSQSITECYPVLIQNVYADFPANRMRVYVMGKGPNVIMSADVLNAHGVAMPLTNASALPMNIGQGERKLIEFNTTTDMTACSNFSKAVVTTKCVSDEKSKPDNC
ncbi:MAG TPA: archaellin/type IV pilin N-terminal domain-containing protein [archaeon]|nr:archaellin/type IV pilin N-terminal domain-containing protein [archaeon]